MLVGYVGMGLIAKAIAPRVGLGSLFAAALLLDILLWLFVIVHIEGAVLIPAPASSVAFDFPYSHSLAGAVLWSLLAALVWTWSGGEGKYWAFAPLVVALTVFSHWVLDAFVGPSDLPLWGPGAPSVGLGIGGTGAFAVACATGLLGLCLYVWCVPAKNHRRVAIAGLLAGSAVLSFIATFHGGPLNILGVAAVSLLVMFLIVTAGAIVDREDP